MSAIQMAGRSIQKNTGVGTNKTILLLNRSYRHLPDVVNPVNRRSNLHGIPAFLAIFITALMSLLRANRSKSIELICLFNSLTDQLF